MLCHGWGNCEARMLQMRRGRSLVVEQELPGGKRRGKTWSQNKHSWVRLRRHWWHPSHGRQGGPNRQDGWVIWGTRGLVGMTLGLLGGNAHLEIPFQLRRQLVSILRCFF